MADLDTAVILAAGRGARMKAAGTERPKGFLRLGSMPIVEESVVRLAESGVRRIVIVTGFLSTFYGELAGRYPGLVTLVHNPLFAESGSMYSLSLARSRVGDGFLLLESDLVYEKRALGEIRKEPSSDAILVSEPTGAGDEVHVEASPEGLLVALSKDRSRLGPNVVGELVGISKLSPSGFEAMLSHADHTFLSTLHLDYEGALVAASPSVPVRCRVVSDLAWSEIDDEKHLSRAQREIYPAIVSRDGAGPGGNA
ncbi:MAG: NTP transferase domain-containing protein [Thermoanaerobaculia bacterium]